MLRMWKEGVVDAWLGSLEGCSVQSGRVQFLLVVSSRS